jgi:hypothetical protein
MLIAHDIDRSQARQGSQIDLLNGSAAGTANFSLRFE